MSGSGSSYDSYMDGGSSWMSGSGDFSDGGSSYMPGSDSSAPSANGLGTSDYGSDFYTGYGSTGTSSATADSEPESIPNQTTTPTPENQQE